MHLFSTGTVMNSTNYWYNLFGDSTICFFKCFNMNYLLDGFSTLPDTEKERILRLVNLATNQPAKPKPKPVPTPKPKPPVKPVKRPPSPNSDPNKGKKGRTDTPPQPDLGNDIVFPSIDVPHSQGGYNAPLGSFLSPYPVPNVSPPVFSLQSVYPAQAPGYPGRSAYAPGSGSSTPSSYHA